MKNYWVYAELFGRKVKIKVFAKSEDEAKQKVKDIIIIHKLEVAPDDEFNDIIDAFEGPKEMMNGKSKVDNFINKHKSTN